jgi:hypothetical protein
LTIRNGTRPGTFDEGGGLYWDGGGGHLHLTNVIFESNAARYGGGLYLNYSGQGDAVDMDHVIVRANTAGAAAGGLGINFDDFAGFDMRNSQVYCNAAYEGGGIYLQGTPSFGLLSARIETSDVYSNTASLSAGFENHSGNSAVPVVMLNSHLHDNAAGFYGGAIGNYGTLIISATTLNGNSAASRGGGIYNYTGGTVAVTNSAISSNVVSGTTGSLGGGGIYTEASTIQITTSTISGNRVTNGSGGGIFNGLPFTGAGGMLSLANCTIAGNSATGGSGGGITNTSINTANARNTLIANNTASSSPDFAGTLVILGWDLIGNTSGTTTSGSGFSSRFNVNPLLGPLQDNGGPTFTHALLPGSLAIDAGNSSGLTTDQRGAPRFIDDPTIRNAIGNDASDIGAFEFGQARLAIQKAGTAAVLSWPSYYGGLTVQSVTNPILSNAWATVAGTPVVSGNQYSFTNNPISGHAFYRLKGNQTQGNGMRSNRSLELELSVCGGGGGRAPKRFLAVLSGIVTPPESSVRSARSVGNQPG